MASTPTLIPIEEYLRTSYHPDADYVDGEMRAGDSRFERWGRLQLTPRGFNSQLPGAGWEFFGFRGSRGLCEASEGKT
jgi:hypothetical protein